MSLQTGAKRWQAKHGRLQPAFACIAASLPAERKGPGEHSNRLCVQGTVSQMLLPFAVSQTCDAMGAA